MLKVICGPTMYHPSRESFGNNRTESKANNGVEKKQLNRKMTNFISELYQSMQNLCFSI
jgi:hypothetical protein